MSKCVTLCVYVYKRQGEGESQNAGLGLINVFAVVSVISFF